MKYLPSLELGLKLHVGWRPLIGAPGVDNGRLPSE
jgi:hypothetical protein